jgi:hypothetical protein
MQDGGGAGDSSPPSPDWRSCNNNFNPDLECYMIIKINGVIAHIRYVSITF